MQKVSDMIEVKENGLQDKFIEALKSETFKGIVNKLDVDAKKLYKYTSGIENSSSELEHCINCKGLFECKNELTGYCNLPEKDGESITFSYKACRYKEKDIENNKYKENLNLFDMPSALKDAEVKYIYTDDASRKDAIKYILNYLEEYKKGNILKGLYLHGSFGCGKTYLIAALLNELAKKGEKSAIIYLPDFLRTLKASFTKSEDEEASFSDKYEYIKNIKYLLIDDIGAENVTAWGRDEILGTLLQHRMNEKLPTFFTSNLNIEQLEEHLSLSKDKTDKVKARRITERIKTLCEDIEVIGVNRR